MARTTSRLWYDSAVLSCLISDNNQNPSQGPGDLWYFPPGVPHSLQATAQSTNGTEFLLVFPDGDFSEDSTFLVRIHTLNLTYFERVQLTLRVLGSSPTGCPTSPKTSLPRTSRQTCHPSTTFPERSSTSSRQVRSTILAAFEWTADSCVGL